MATDFVGVVVAAWPAIAAAVVVVVERVVEITKSRIVVFTDLMHESTHALACQVFFFVSSIYVLVLPTFLSAEQVIRVIAAGS